MKHDQFKEWVQLSQYDELDTDEREMLKKHLETCDECRDEHAKLDRMNKLLSRSPAVEPDDQLLREARLELRAALRLEKKRRERWSSLNEFIGGLFFPKFAFALGGVAFIAVGIFLGRIIIPPEIQSKRIEAPGQISNASLDQGNAKISNVRFLNNPRETGEVEFTFDAVTPVHIKGNVNDERVQKVLTYALLNDDNPGVRLRSVNAIGLQSNQTRVVQDQVIKNALIKALKSDENPAVRKEALKALQKFTVDDEIKKTLISVLVHDINPGIRIAVINILDSARVEGKPLDQDILDVLKQRMKSDDNNYIRIRAKEALGEVKQ
ncbi:MAG: HEAT repeat domain-containing protein [Bacteroidota bacterium]